MGWNLRNFFPFWLFRSGVAIGFILLVARSGQAQVDSLSAYKSFYITGGHASAGKNMRGTGQQGLATADISVTIPVEGADILAAYLYWQTLEKTIDASSAQGVLLDPCNSPLFGPPPASCATDKPVPPPDPTHPATPLTYPATFVGKPLGQDHTAPCWSNGGSTGSSQGAPTLRVYRADILRYLQISQLDSQKWPVIRVQLPDSGKNGNTVPITEGASLVIIYRKFDLPFRQIFIFDGAATMNGGFDSLYQTLPFYQTTGTPKAIMTYIVGDGQSNFPERLWFSTDPTQLASPATPLADSPFAGPDWDDQTFTVTVPTTLAGPYYTAYTKVDHGSGSFDCLNLAAILWSLELRDDDSDGIATDWENQGYKALGTHTMLVNLPAINSDAQAYLHKDIYIEVDRMQEWGNDFVGSPHAHKVKKDAIDMVCAAFLRAGIAAHFDVGIGDDGTGKNYQNPPDSCIIPAAYSEGGDVWNERTRATYCVATVPNGDPNCKFPNQPGVTFWKTGLQFIKQEPVPEDQDHIQLDSAGKPIGPFKAKTYFNGDIRGPIFHYMLFVHALGQPDLDENGNPVPGPALYADGTAVSGNDIPPVPNGLRGLLASSSSGRSELPGGDSLIALGRWSGNVGDAQVGSKNLQAATVLHEVAHNLWGYHGGELLEPNCKVTQLSSLNYLYQSAGLLDAAGLFNVDLSGTSTAVAPNQPPNENALQESNGVSTVNTAYRLRWYVPRTALAVLGLDFNTITPASRHCDGTPLGDPLNPPAGHYGGNPDNLVRVDGQGVQGNPLAGNPVDWDYDRVLDVNAFIPNSPTSYWPPNPTTPHWPDINFNGVISEGLSNFTPKSDWTHIGDYNPITNPGGHQGLRQIGSRRSLYGLSVGTKAVDLLLEGEAASGEHDSLTPQILGEAASGEAASGEAASGEAASGEAASGEAGSGEAASGEAASGEAASGAKNEINERMALAVGNAPYGLTATGTNKGVVLNWFTPPVGITVQYIVHRLAVTATGTTDPTTFPTITGTAGTPPVTTFTDGSAKTSLSYFYYVIAGLRTGDSLTIKYSNPSNLFLLLKK